MNQYEPILKGDPSPESLVELFNRSSPDDWIFDEEGRVFSLRERSVVRVAMNERGGFSLQYAFDEVKPLTVEDVSRHLPQMAVPMGL